MRWFKFYSVAVLLFIAVTAVLSFYIMDFSPILYKFYMGTEISSSKMDKLYSFGLKITNELRVYLVFTFITFVIMYFLSTLKQYFIVLALFIGIHFIFIAEIGDFVIFKRFYQMFIMIPLLWIFFDFLNFKKETYKNRITHGFLYIILLSIILPGLYLPPFFSGIPGWTVQIDKSENIAIDGVFLVRNDGEEIRFSRSIVSPINFVTRLNSYIVKKHPDEIKNLLNFYKETYIKRYKILEKGLTPSQNILGKLAYPTHNPQGNFDYSKFPPKSIKEIKLSTKYYSWDKKFISEKIIAKEDWK